MKKFLFILLSLCFQLASCTQSQQHTDNDAEALPLTDKEIVCFVYHRFGDNRFPSTNVSIKDFEAHLKHLKENDFQVLTFSDAIDYLNSNKEKQKTVVITIDDGYTSFYKNGLPLLKKYGIPATLFINTKTIGGGSYMGWEEVNDAIKDGIEIGNHTHSHAYFLNLPASSRYNSFKEELQQTQNLIKKNTATVPDVFAYPYGELDAKMKKIVEEMGFKAAAAQNSGVIYAGTDLMQCPRFPMSEYYADPDKFTGKAAMHALKVNHKNPQSFLLPSGESKPQLTIQFNGSNLRLDQLQCFVQGSECQKILSKKDNGTVELTVKPTDIISQRRRTLYTITVPDNEGQWYWFSHLWINPVVTN